MKERGSGILLHITSLSSPFGIGDLGPWAYRFADFLAESQQRIWQILPLNPTEISHGNSPYHSLSAFALNPLLISPEILAEEGFLSREAFTSAPNFPSDRVDYPSVSTFKKGLFEKVFEGLKTANQMEDYTAFCSQRAAWLEDYALFSSLKAHFQGKVWSEWPPELRDRNPDALKSARGRLYDAIEKEKLLQYLAFKQWFALKKYCNDRGIFFLGDIPIYVVHDSADAWTHPEYFKLDEEKRPYAVAGVPPDYFSETGQLWGNPVFRWDVMKETGYLWWNQRMSHNLEMYDLVRVDHFRGFVAYWEVPATQEKAVNGQWVKAPAMDFFTHLKDAFPSQSVIAEDLGFITPDVTEVMNHFGFPGMKVLLFAFGDIQGKNPYLPHNHVKNCVVYTGTHDNNTVRGWFERDATQEEREHIFRYLGLEVRGDNIHKALLSLAMMSVADRVIIPMQDLLGLGEEARMNRPAKKTGNWQWRLLPEQLTPDLSKELREITKMYGRSPNDLPADLTHCTGEAFEKESSLAK